MLIIRNGNIHDAVHRAPYISDIAISNGKIAAIGKDLPGDGGEVEVVDASGLEVYPGLVEAHGHT